MFEVVLKKCRSSLLLGAFSTVVGLSLVPVQPSFAQARALPDFTDLVEQVGPSVVNIRTSEKVKSRANAGPGSSPGNGADEEMQEFFRRFFGQPMPGTPRQTPRQSSPRK